jgi:hypothetical protein
MFLRNRSKAPDRFRQARHGTSQSDSGLSEYARILASLCEKVLRLTAMRGFIALLKRYPRNLDENLISLEYADAADVLRQDPYKARNSRVASRVPDYFVTLLTF